MEGRIMKIVLVASKLLTSSIVGSMMLALALALALALLAPQAAVAQAVQGVTDNEIVLGSIVDLSGTQASIGSTMRDGMTLALEEINEAGGISGRKIKLVLEDSGYDPKKGVLAAQKLVLQNKVFALIGTLGSAVHLATQNIAMERGVPLLFPIVATDASYLPHSPLKFALLGAGEDAMRSAVAYMYKQGKRNFAIFYQDDEKGLTDLRSAEEQLKVYGLSLVEKASHKRGDINYSSQVAKLKAAKPDVVLLGTIPREVGVFAVEAKAQDWKFDGITTNGPSRVAIEVGGAAVEGIYGAVSVALEAQEITPAYTALLQKYKARFDRDLRDGVNVGYTAMMLFAEGAKNAGKDLTPQTLAKGLEQVRDFKTVFDMVPITYSSDYHGPPKSVFIIQVQKGHLRRVAGPLRY